jgi:CO/xanthine dehydrogenase Mo-binding subunit
LSSDRNLLATFSNVFTLVGVYAFPAAHVHVTSVMTNTNSTAPYRGAGRPEATYVIERLIDDAARELGLDRVELRRKNVIPSSAMPYRTALGMSYDCGDFARNMDDAVKLADLAGFAARREEAKARGRLRGLPSSAPSSGRPRGPDSRRSLRPSGIPLHGHQSRARATDDVQADPPRSSPRSARGALHRRRHGPGRLR